MIVIFFCIWSQQWGKLLMHPLSWNNGGSAWRMLFPWSSICFLSKWKNTSPTWSSLLPLSFPFLLSLKLWLLKLTERKQWMTEAIEKCYVASGINKIWFLKRLTLKAECSAVNRTSVSYPLLSRFREHWRGKGGKVCKSQRGGVISRTQQGGCTHELTAGCTASTRPCKPKPDRILAWGGEVGVKS